MNPAPKLHVLLALSKLTDAGLLDLVGNIGKLGPQSTLAGNPIIATCLGGVSTKAAAFKTSCQTVKDTAKQLVDDKTSRSEDRAALETEVNALVANATNLGSTEADLTGLALTPRQHVVIPTSGPPVPAMPIATMPKYHTGYFDISVNELGGTRGRYVAEWSGDPIGTWALLTGTGKSRRVTGVSGTRVWVRFARVRGRQQSDWSTPALVIIP